MICTNSDSVGVKAEAELLLKVRSDVINYFLVSGGFHNEMENVQKC